MNFHHGPEKRNRAYRPATSETGLPQAWGKTRESEGTLVQSQRSAGTHESTEQSGSEQQTTGVSTLRMTVFPSLKVANDPTKMLYQEEGDTEMRGTGVHAIVPAQHGKKKAVKEIGEKTWRGLRRVREIGEEMHLMEAPEIRAESKGWGNLAANDCREAILQLSERPQTEEESQSIRNECAPTTSGGASYVETEARE